MQTFDMALLALFSSGQITKEEALKNADSPNNLRLKMQHSDGFSSKQEFELMEDPVEEDGEEIPEEEGQLFAPSTRPSLEVKDEPLS